MKKAYALFIALLLFIGHGNVQAELAPEDKKSLNDAYKIIKFKKKGPYTANYCTCENGQKAPVADKNMKIRPRPCAADFGSKQLFCSAYRNEYAEILARYGVYVANIFSNEVYLWDSHKDHHRLARGFILEKFHMDMHSEAKLAQSRAFGGISGLEFEARDAPLFFAKYYSLPDWTDFYHYLIQYEIQKRFFCKPDAGLLNDIRVLSMSMTQRFPEFKPVKDTIHNRLSPGTIALVENFMQTHSDGIGNKGDYTKLMDMIRTLTNQDQQQLNSYLSRISNKEIREKIQAVAQAGTIEPITLLNGLGDLSVRCRKTIAEKHIEPKEAVELINLALSANQVMQVTAVRLMEQQREWKFRELLMMMKSLSGGIYGAGLMSLREYDTAVSRLTQLVTGDDMTIGEIYQGLNHAARVVEWAQSSIRSAFSDVWEPWVFLFPDVDRISDDIIRSSPLIAYAAIVNSLREHLSTQLNLQHDLFGKKTTHGIRALNPGLTVGPLSFYKDQKEYSRDDIIALESTNAELEPVAGIITRDEGNVVSHVQLLARSLGVPNAVFLADVYDLLPKAGGNSLFYAISPMGRVILKETSQMSPADTQILEQYEKNKKRTTDADIRGHSGKLAIDGSRLDLGERRVQPLEKIRRKDSGVICGPKAAFLGELKHFFPENVSRGVVVPFGVYADHFRKAVIVVPENLKSLNLAVEGASLSEFVQTTYQNFFGSMLADKTMSSKELAEWITPRLTVIRHSLEQITLDPVFTEELRTAMMNQGLFRDENKLVGVFVRSDTNVEDLPNFNGAGLNLTLFNLMNFDDVLEGIRKVWASPFSYRSFSWRQSVISDPALVFPSLVILESVPSEKSGVLITADVITGDPAKMTIATAEGVGGTVDGSQAETLLYHNGKTELLAQFKSPFRRMLILEGKGGSQMVPSTGSEIVLEESELAELTKAAEKIRSDFKPEYGFEREPLPWDIEYGFVGGHLYLFQTRPFVGNSDMQNLPALASLDRDVKRLWNHPFSMEETLKWQP